MERKVITIERLKISSTKLRKLITCFCHDISATDAAILVRLNRNTVNRYYTFFRQVIYEACLKEHEKLSGEVEIDESYFGARRVRGKRGRGAAGKIPVCGLLKRNGKVYTQVLQGVSRKELLPIIQGKVLDTATLYTDGWKAYDSLVLNGYKHYRIHHHENEFARGKNHINGIESFWSFAKRRLAKLNTTKHSHFDLYLKECEWRFNHRSAKLETELKKLLKNSLI